MRKLLILLAVFVFIVAYAVPAIAIPRASPIPMLNDWMIMPTAMAAPTAPATSNPLKPSCLVVTPRAMATATTFMKSDRIWNQAALNANYNYHGRPICLTGALISNEEDTSRIIAMVSEDVISVTLISMKAAQDRTLRVLLGSFYFSVAPVVAFNDDMEAVAIMGQRHNAAYNTLSWTNTNLLRFTAIRMQVRSTSAIHSYFALAYLRANEFSFGQQEQRAAYNDCNLLTVIRMADSNIIGTNRVGTVSRL